MGPGRKCGNEELGGIMSSASRWCPEELIRDACLRQTPSEGTPGPQDRIL